MATTPTPATNAGANLHGRVALVTGGSRGIGAATSQLLAARGAKVAVNYANNTEAAEELVKAIEEHGGTALALKCDVRDQDEIDSMVKTIVKRWGRVDILVSNANMRFAVKPLSEMNWDEFSQKLNDEMKAAFLLTKAVTPIMTQNAYGRIVYIASGLAKHVGPGMAAHGSAKAALVQFARYVAAEFGPKGIVANIISPGLVMTDATRFIPDDRLRQMASMTPLGRVAQPEDVAHAVAMYVGADCQFVTGSYVPVNGGSSMD